MPKKNNPSAPQIFHDNNSIVSTRGQCDCDCDCDCACSLPTLDIASPISSLNKESISLLRTTNFSSLNLDEIYSVCFGSSCKISVVNQETLSILKEFRNQPLSNITYANIAVNYGEDAANAALKKLIETGLLTSSKESESPKDVHSHALAAWLHVTDRCNLRCSYCYLPHQPNDMNLKTGMAIIKSIFRSAQTHGYAQVKIKYAGGEPLLRFDEILAWHSYACELGKRFGIYLDGIILTNGTLLTSNMIDSVQKAGLGLMISLDGLESAHDVQRSYADRRGSFKEVSNAVDTAIKQGLIPNISVTISAKNSKSLPDLVKWIRERNLPFALNFARENSYFAHRLTPSDEQEIINGMLNAFKVIEENMPEQSVLNGLVDRANLTTPHLRTCSIEENYLVFDYQGNIFRCQMDMAHPLATLQTKADPLSVIQKSADPINISVDFKEDCNQCKWKYWCAGGCPLLTQRVTGSCNAASPYCKIYKALYPEAFRLEGFRLLQKYKHSQNVA